MDGAVDDSLIFPDLWGSIYYILHTHTTETTGIPPRSPRLRVRKSSDLNPLNTRP